MNIIKFQFEKEFKIDTNLKYYDFHVSQRADVINNIKIENNLDFDIILNGEIVAKSEKNIILVPYSVKIIRIYLKNNENSFQLSYNYYLFPKYLHSLLHKLGLEMKFVNWKEYNYFTNNPINDYSSLYSSLFITN